MSSEKSFAERFGSNSKKTFTSQSIIEKAAEKKSTTQIIEEAKNASPTSEAATAKKVDPMKRAQASLIYLVKGVDDGRNAWYYVLVERPKLQLFLKALNDDIIHLEHYGKVLYSAYGDEPPQHITDALNEEYGIK
jgi:hypothetical protein